jgi:hypothetical protein
LRLKILLLVFLTPLTAGNPPLKAGAKYDFLARDGQHVYAAIFVKETEGTYVVKTDGFGDETLEVEKSILSGPPRPSSDKLSKDTVAGRWARPWSISVTGDLRMASGTFSDYALFFPGASVRLSRKVDPIPHTWGINAFSLLVQYAPIVRSPRRIDLINFALGPKWRKRFRKLPRAEFSLHAAPTLSLLHYSSYTFDTWSANFGFAAAVGMDWWVGSNWAMVAVLGTHYIHDKSSFVLMHNLSLGVSYAW